MSDQKRRLDERKEEFEVDHFGKHKKVAEKNLNELEMRNSVYRYDSKLGTSPFFHTKRTHENQVWEKKQTIEKVFFQKENKE